MEAEAAVVTLTGVDPVGCAAVLEYLATGALRVPGCLEDALGVLGVAERFMVAPLQEELVPLIKTLVTPANIGSLLRFTDAAGREELCTWACNWAVTGGHATSLVRSGCLAGLPGGAAHALMLAIATRADAATGGTGSPGGGDATHNNKTVTAGGDPSSAAGGTVNGGGVKRKHSDDHAGH